MLTFSTKEESNERRKKAFLALEPRERLMQFFKLLDTNYLFQNPNQTSKNSDNFILEK